MAALTQSEKGEFTKKLVKHIQEISKLTQGELAKKLGMSQQAFNNRLQRGTAPLSALADFMRQNAIPIPDWAAELQTSEDELRDELEKIQISNAELMKRLESAEKHQEELMHLLKLALEKK